MSETETVEHALAALRAAGAAQADALLVSRDQLEVRVRGEEVDAVQQARTRSLDLRAFVDSEAGLRAASTSTSDLSREEVERLAAETVALAQSTAADPAAGLPDGGFCQEIPDLALFDPADRPWKVDEEVDACRRAERAARAADPRVTNSEGSQSNLSFSELAYGNSAGFMGAFRTGRYGFYAMPVAEADGEKQTDFWHDAARCRSELSDPESLGATAGRRAARRLGGRPVPTCEVPVVFEGPVAGSLLGHLFGCLSGYSLYRGSSFLADRLGDAIASELVTIIDDGRRRGGLGSRPFDAEGLPTRRSVLVDRGRLAGYVYDSYSARKCGAESTGSGARAGAGVTVAPTNLWLEPGAGTLDELIAATDRGLLVTELMGMGFNPVTGDYSRGAAGFWIEGGELTHPVQEVTVAGNLEGMLSSVDGVAADLVWRERLAAPSLRIARMTVAGQ